MQFTISITVNEITKIKKDSVDLSLCPKRIDVALWGLTTASTGNHLLQNITLILKINTAKFKIEPTFVPSESYLKSILKFKINGKR